VNGKAITAEIDSMGFLAAKRMQIKRDMMHQSGGLVGKPLRKVSKLVGISNKRILVVEYKERNRVFSENRSITRNLKQMNVS